MNNNNNPPYHFITKPLTVVVEEDDNPPYPLRQEEPFREERKTIIHGIDIRRTGYIYRPEKPSYWQ